MEAGYRGYFTTATDMVSAMTTACADRTFTTKMRAYTSPSVLVIEDVGITPLTGTSPRLLPGRQPPLRERLRHGGDHQPGLVGVG